MTTSHFKERERALMKVAFLLSTAICLLFIPALSSAQSPPVLVLQWVGPNGGQWGNGSNWSYSGSTGGDFVVCNGNTCTVPLDYVDIDNTTVDVVGTVPAQVNIAPQLFAGGCGNLSYCPPGPANLAGLILGANAPGGGLLIPGGSSVTVQGETDVGVNYPATVTITNGGTLINAGTETKLTVAGQIFYLLGPPTVPIEFGDFSEFEDYIGFPNNIIPASVLSSLVSFSSLGQSNGYIGGSSGPPVAGATPSGTVIVTGASSQWQLTGNLYVGSPGQGTLQISNGGSVTDASAQVGVQSGATGAVTISGSGSEWQNSTGQLEIGVAGTGTLTVNTGAAETSVDGLDMGVMSGGNGTVTLTDAGTSWTNRGGQVIVGDAGTGTLTIKNNAAVDTASDLDAGGFSVVVANQAGSQGLMVVDSGFLTDLGSLVVGNAGNGSLTVQNEGVIDDAQAAIIASVSGSTGTAMVSGTGSQWNIAGPVQIGAGGQGSLTLQDGATVATAGTLDIGVDPGSNGHLTLTGAGTIWNNVSDLITVGDQGAGTLTIKNGAILSTPFTGFEGTNTIGSQPGSLGGASVEGAGSQWKNLGNLCVGCSGTGFLTVSGGGLVTDQAGFLGLDTGSNGTALVTGPGSTWHNSATLDVGISGPGSLTVNNGGVVSAGTLANPGTITIGTEGTVDAAGGTLQGNVINHGTLDPVGTITIEGDYTQGMDGTLILEVAGTGAGDYGQFDVSGDATFDGTIDLDFIDGFAPSTGDSFDFIHVTGSTDFSGATIGIAGLEPGFEYSDEFTNGDFTLAALNDGISSSPVNDQTPEPGTLLLFATALVVLMACCRLRFLRVGV